MMTPCFTGLNRTNLVAVLPLSAHASESVYVRVCVLVHEALV